MRSKFLLALFLLFPFSTSAAETKPFFRSAGEYLSHRSVRMGLPTATNPVLLTDGKRFDATLGKRLNLLEWSVKSPANAWFAGIDAGVLASLQRYNRAGQLIFATNTFDGFFGAYLGKALDGWLFLARFAHLSAHLVDNSPNILNPVSYSQFWEEVVVGKTFPNPEVASPWEVHLQGSVGLNHSSFPANKQPRASLGVSAGHALGGLNSVALLASADVLRAGVQNQKPSYAAFLGLGSLNRPDSTTRPYRAGLAFHRGSDYRNQNYNRKQNWTTFELSTEF